MADVGVVYREQTADSVSAHINIAEESTSLVVDPIFIAKGRPGYIFVIDTLRVSTEDGDGIGAPWGFLAIVACVEEIDGSETARFVCAAMAADAFAEVPDGEETEMVYVGSYGEEHNYTDSGILGNRTRQPRMPLKERRTGPFTAPGSDVELIVIPKPGDAPSLGTMIIHVTGHYEAVTRYRAARAISSSIASWYASADGKWCTATTAATGTLAELHFSALGQMHKLEHMWCNGGIPEALTSCRFWIGDTPDNLVAQSPRVEQTGTRLMQWIANNPVFGETIDGTMSSSGIGASLGWANGSYAQGYRHKSDIGTVEGEVS